MHGSFPQLIISSVAFSHSAGPGTEGFHNTRLDVVDIALCG